MIGFKDGHSDLDQLQRLKLAAPPEWLFFNGAATAEMQARAYRSIGVPAYSSAVHAFAPEIAKSFFLAFHADDHARVDLLLSRFYVPLVELRDKGIGYGVSLIKAAARLRGAPVGPVRAPLADPSPEHLEELRALLDTGLVGARPVRKESPDVTTHAPDRQGDRHADPDQRSAAAQRARRPPAVHAAHHRRARDRHRRHRDRRDLRRHRIPRRGAEPRQGGHRPAAHRAERAAQTWLTTRRG